MQIYIRVFCKEFEQKGIYYIADTLINRHPDEDVLIDVAKLSVPQNSISAQLSNLHQLVADLEAIENGGKKVSMSSMLR